MDKYLTLEEAAEYLNVNEDTIKRYIDRGELPFYKLDRALRFKKSDIDKLVTKQFERLLVPGLRVAVSYSCPIKDGWEAWRVILVFYDTTQKTRRTIPFGTKVKKTEYRIFITGEYLRDVAHLPANIYGAEKFALKYIQQRFEETRNKRGDRDINLITENEIFCINGKCSRNPNKQFFS